MATFPLLFDLGRSPTTRDIANLVKDGGVGALPDAVRRGDAATYQEIRCRSALNRVKGMPFIKWTLNPYRGCTHGCHYCFARRYQTQLELNTGDDFASVIFVKTNFVEVLRRELDQAIVDERVHWLRYRDRSLPADRRHLQVVARRARSACATRPRRSALSPRDR